ncbi:glycogen synthase [Patescibacteria group bacterium]|nr:glycogen synthase [Patescibacteria group bacterium]MDE1988277.1 glycogen synthase [Patescibacteria group bacterium]
MRLSKKNTALKILFVASEASPFVKVGGLGEVMYSLPKALREIGHDARVMIPKYSSIDSAKFPMTVVKEGLLVPKGVVGGLSENDQMICNVKKFLDPDNGHAVTYLLENEEYYEQRGSVYGYDVDPMRWALLSRGALEFVRTNNDEWRPDVIVASDWQGGLIPNYIKTVYKDDSILSKIATAFSIHNLYFQGMFDHRFVSEMDYDDGQSEIPSIGDPKMSKMNFMRRGIRYADVINTVSPNYAREITTSEYGELLDNLLQERRSHLFGILNGINYDAYNPETDSYINFKYNAKNLKERAKNKEILRQKFNLPQVNNKFIIGIVSRLSEQKGLDVLMEAIEPMLNNFDFEMVVVGQGDSKYMSFFTDLEKKYPSIKTHLSYDAILPRFVFAGADAILIPSKFEPCGLTQMEAMRYGCVPIVRKTGGLADSVEDYNPTKQTGTGFVFEKFDKFALFGTMIRVLETYKYPKFWEGIQKRAMSANFSWTNSAKEYAEIFKKAIDFNLQSKKPQ